MQLCSFGRYISPCGDAGPGKKGNRHASHRSVQYGNDSEAKVNGPMVPSKLTFYKGFPIVASISLGVPSLFSQVSYAFLCFSMCFSMFFSMLFSTVSCVLHACLCFFLCLLLSYVFSIISYDVLCCSMIFPRCFCVFPMCVL